MNDSQPLPNDDSHLSEMGRNVMGSSGGSSTSGTGTGGGRWTPPTAEELAAELTGYEIVKMLGRGGMGAVYMGRQTSLDRPVAIKILSSELEEADSGFADRFQNEARAMAKLNHPGIVAVHDFGETETGLLFIVMEYVDGTDVARMIAADGRLHTDYAMAITAHVCDALNYAHELGIIHRDIKPANIMVGYDGVVKVADFGLAKACGGEDESVGLTQSGMIMGTMHYMAPEMMILGSKEVDQRADVYAVGVMLYHMLTGKVPHGMFELPSIQVDGMDPRYDGIIAKAMREDREARYASAGELRSDLDAILTQPVVHVEATTDAEAQVPAALPTQARPQRPVGGRTMVTGVARRSPEPVSVPKQSSNKGWLWPVVIAAVILIGGGWWWMQDRDTKSPLEVPIAETKVQSSPKQTAKPQEISSATSKPVVSPTVETPAEESRASTLPKPATTPVPEENADWISLFNGRDLDDWVVRSGSATFRVEEEAIVGRTTEGSKDTTLCTIAEFGDFELEFEVKVDDALNSGVDIRTRLKKDMKFVEGGEIQGLQVEVEASPGSSGYIYGQGTGMRWVTSNPADNTPPPDNNHFRNGEWNQFRVLAVGPRIRTWINDEPVTDINRVDLYSEYASGFIGLQVHGIKRGEGPYEVAWRNLRIREIGDSKKSIPPAVTENSTVPDSDEWENLYPRFLGDGVLKSGAWTLRDETLEGRSVSSKASIGFPMAPLTNFDLSFETLRRAGPGGIAVSFPTRSGGAGLVCIGRNTLRLSYHQDFERSGSARFVGHRDLNRNITNTGTLTHWQVKVRADRVSVEIDGQPLVDFENVDWSEYSQKGYYFPFPQAQLGFGINDVDMDIKSIRLRRIEEESTAVTPKPVEFSSIPGEWWQRVEGAGDTAYQVTVMESGDSRLQTGSVQLDGKWEATDTELVFHWSNGVTCRFPTADLDGDVRVMRGTLEKGDGAAVAVQLAKSKDVILEAAMLGRDSEKQSPTGSPPDRQRPITLFDGESLDGWRLDGDPRSFIVEDGMIKTTAINGGNLIYVGDGPEAPQFTDFDLRLKVYTGPKGNSGVWIHLSDVTKSQFTRTLEAQICNEGKDDQKTGSIYEIEPVSRVRAKDGEWFDYRIVVKGKTLTTYIDSTEAASWTQPEDWVPPVKTPNARIGSGTIGLQGHKGGPVWFKDIELTLPK